jgi:dUTP pyrophosphatase
MVANSPGTIDSDYRGEIVVGLLNMGMYPYSIEAGSRIAQGVLAPVTHAVFVEAKELEETERGAGGLGSTGK